MERDPIYRRADMRLRMHELLSKQIIVEEVNFNPVKEEPQMAAESTPTETNRNVHRFRSLGEVVVALGHEDLDTLFSLRQSAYNRMAEAQEDIRVVEEEIAARDNSEATLQLGSFGH